MLPDHGPGDLVVALSCGFHRMTRHVVERYHVGEDSHGLIERTEPVGGRHASEISTKPSRQCLSSAVRSALPVVRSVSVLLQEVVFDQLGDFKGDFIGFCQRCLLER